MTLTEKQKRILRWLGYPLLVLVVFSFTLHLSFPYERLKDELIELASPRYEVQIASIEPTFLPGGVVLESVLLKTRATQAGEEPTAILLERLRVDLGLLALLRRRADVDIVADIGEGSIDGNVVLGPSEIEAHFATEDLPLESIPGLRAAVGLPMQGGLDAELDIHLPEQRWDLAEGSFTLSCPSCVIGDGEAKIKPRRRSRRRSRRRLLFAGEGLTVPALNLGDLHGKIVFGDGRGVIEEFSAQSGDGDLALHGAVELGREFADTRFTQACMKFRLSDALKQREPEFGNVPSLMGAPPESDGFSNVKMAGKLSRMRWIAARSCEEDGSAERLRRASRSRSRSRARARARAERGRPTLPANPDRSEADAGDQRAPGEEGSAPTIPPPTGPAAAERQEGGDDGDSPPERARDGRRGRAPDQGEDEEDEAREQEREQRVEQLIEERERLREERGVDEGEMREGDERDEVYEDEEDFDDGEVEDFDDELEGFDDGEPEGFDDGEGDYHIE